MTDREYERMWADIPWRKPLMVRPLEALENPDVPLRYACRYCIARHGLKGSEVEQVPFVMDTAEQFEQHLQTEHKVDNCVPIS